MAFKLISSASSTRTKPGIVPIGDHDQRIPVEQMGNGVEVIAVITTGNLPSVMYRSTVSVDWQGWLSDCDFNQHLGLPLGISGLKRHLRDLLKTRLDEQPIRVAGHCFGCATGQGSSCGGALAA